MKYMFSFGIITCFTLPLTQQRISFRNLKIVYKKNTTENRLLSTYFVAWFFFWNLLNLTIYVIFQSRGYWSRMPGHFRMWPPSWTDWHTWPRSHAVINPMPDNMNLDYLKLFCCKFQKYEVMTISVVGGQQKKHANRSFNATKDIEGTFLITDYH